MNEMGVHGIKFHPLSVVRGSRLEKKPPLLFERIEYIELIVDLIERLSPEITIQRLVGGGRPEMHIAPDWVMIPAKVIQKIRKEMKKRGSFQGCKIM